MPPKPIKRLKAVAKSATIAISVITTTRKLGKRSGSTTSTTRATSQRTELTCSFLGPAQETPGADDQDDGHDREEQHDGHRREHENPERLQLADQECADEATGEAPQPTDAHHHKRR